MANTETLTAYKCRFSYLQRNNPLKEELKAKMADGLLPEYTFQDFIAELCQYTSSLAVGESTERAISLPEEKIFPRSTVNESSRWRIVPYVGKQGKPFRIIKTSTGKKYDFGSDSAALYEHNIFIYQGKTSAVVIFHRQSGSGCKSVFLEVANNMLREKGIKLNMELYMPLLSSSTEVKATKITLKYVLDKKSSDITENIHKRKRPEVIQELSLNLKSDTNSHIRNIVNDMRLGKITQEIAFIMIKNECPGADIYNDAEIQFQIGKRSQKVRWNEFESVLGNYDITNRLHKKFWETKNFIQSLTELTDEYYNAIMVEENGNEK